MLRNKIQQSVNPFGDNVFPFGWKHLVLFSCPPELTSDEYRVVYVLTGLLRREANTFATENTPPKPPAQQYNILSDDEWRQSGKTSQRSRKG